MVLKLWVEEVFRAHVSASGAILRSFLLSKFGFRMSPTAECSRWTRADPWKLDGAV